MHNVIDGKPKQICGNEGGQRMDFDWRVSCTMQMNIGLGL